MKNIVLVIEENESLESINFLKKICEKVRKRLQKIDNNIEKLQIYQDVNLFIFKLPYTKTEIENFKLNRLLKISDDIFRFCNENNIYSCVFSNKISSLFKECNKLFEDCSGELLFKCLIMNIINAICSRRKIKVHELDLAIIYNGNKHSFFNAIITFVSPYIKYITVVDDGRINLEQEIEKIYQETGLSIRLTNDLKDSLKNCDVIINLSELLEDMPKYKINSKAIIINYGEIKNLNIIRDRTIINGLKLKLPQFLYEKTEKYIEKDFEGIELAEAILKQRMLEIGNVNFESITHDMMLNMARQFKQEGFAIYGFKGFRNSLRNEVIVL